MTPHKLRTTFDIIQQKQRQATAIYDAYLLVKQTSQKGDELKALLNLGISQYNAGLVDTAIDTFSKAITLEIDADAYHNRGTLFMQKRNVEFAIHDFTAAIMFCPQFPSPYINRALCLMSSLALNDLEYHRDYRDIKQFARQDFEKAKSLGSPLAAKHLSEIDW